MRLKAIYIITDRKKPYRLKEIQSILYSQLLNTKLASDVPFTIVNQATILACASKRHTGMPFALPARLPHTQAGPGAVVSPHWFDGIYLPEAFCTRTTNVERTKNVGLGHLEEKNC